MSLIKVKNKQFEFQNNGIQFYYFFEKHFKSIQTIIMSAYRRLEFSAYCQTNFGQSVAICGNIPQLGYWNPMKGLKLRTEESYYPIWKSFDSLFVLENQPIEFKIVVISGKNEFRWENIMQNRIIVPEIDAYVKLTINEFETYEIFPFCDGDENVRTGMGILNDLSSDGSSSISFKSNYKFYQYYNRDQKRSHHSSIKPKNTSTFRDLSQFQGNEVANFKTQNEFEFVTYIDSLMELEDGKGTGKQITTTQDCTKNALEEEGSHSTNSDREFDEERWENEDWVVYCAGTDATPKNNRTSSKKGHQANRLTSLNKIIYSNSSESLHIDREEE